jgi:hypothetical protein
MYKIAMKTTTLVRKKAYDIIVLKVLAYEHAIVGE